MWTCSILAKTAKLFEKEDDYPKYSNWQRILKKKSIPVFLIQKQRLWSGFQTERSTALFGNCSGGPFRKSRPKLDQKVISDNRHLDVGLLGSKTILNALVRKTNMPIWPMKWPLKRISFLGRLDQRRCHYAFEDWRWTKNEKGPCPENHIMFGGVALGFTRPWGDPTRSQTSRFKNIYFEPHFVKGLERFEAQHNGPHGKILSSWKKVNGKVFYNVVVPPNSRATLIINRGKNSQKKKG